MARKWWQESRVQCVASFPSLIHCSAVPALIVEVDDGAVRPGERGDDETHPGEQLPEVVLDLGDDPARLVPGGSLIVEAAVADQRGVAGSATGPGREILDSPLQYLVGREPDGVRHAALLQRLIQGREGKRRIGSDDDRLLAGLGPLNDREEDLVPPARTVDVAGSERGGQTIASLIRQTRSARCRPTVLGRRAPDSRSCRYPGSGAACPV